MYHNIKDGAIFIADSHYNQKNKQLKQLLLKIKFKEIQPSQIFLMGDIFDCLSSQITYFINQNKELIDLINELADTIEIFYFEGNHDFNLQTLFPNIRVFSRDSQPVVFDCFNKKVVLAHGDIFTPFGYEIYTKIIRNPMVQNILNLIDIKHFISKRVDKWLLNKQICHNCKDDNQFIKNRISYYNADLAIEGHFHFGIVTDKYINLPSLVCSNKYVTYINKNYEEILTVS